MNVPDGERIEALRELAGADHAHGQWMIVATCRQSLEHPGEGGWYTSKAFPGANEAIIEGMVVLARRDPREGPGPYGVPPGMEQGCPVHAHERLAWSKVFQVVLQWADDADQENDRVASPRGCWT